MLPQGYQSYFNEIARIREEIWYERHTKAHFILAVTDDIKSNTGFITPSIVHELENIFRTISDLLKNYEYTEEYFLIEAKQIPKKGSLLNELIHKSLKKNTFESFPDIIDLPSNGFRELDYILFLESQHILSLLKDKSKRSLASV